MAEDVVMYALAAAAGAGAAVIAASGLASESAIVMATILVSARCMSCPFLQGSPL